MSNNYVGNVYSDVTELKNHEGDRQRGMGLGMYPLAPTPIVSSINTFQYTNHDYPNHLILGF